MTTEDSKFGIEVSIQEAMLSGKFENLNGRGKPLDLHEYFETPEDLRVGYSLLKSNGFIPQEMELRKEIAGLRAALVSVSDPDRRKALAKLLNNKQLAYEYCSRPLGCMGGTDRFATTLTIRGRAAILTSLG